MSKNNDFFKPTLLHKEFMILDLIEKDAYITQRKIAASIGVAVSMVNFYIDIFEKNGFLIRKKYSSKTIEYFITKKGSERRKVLNISFLSNSLKIYSSAKENIALFLNQISDKGFKKIILYGAGEVSEILLQSILIDKDIPIEVVGIIDDDNKKHQQELLGKSIMPLDSIQKITHDGILIASYTNKNKIMTKLLNENYDFHRIINFFEI